MSRLAILGHCLSEMHEACPQRNGEFECACHCHQAAKQSPYSATFQNLKLDPYRILSIYGITHPAQQHAIKKLLRAGKSHKPLKQDIEEAIQSLQRWVEMIGEEEYAFEKTLPSIEDVQAIYRKEKAEAAEGKPEPKS